MTNATTSRPRFNPARQEWSQRTGPSTWLVWKHGEDPKDEERLLKALADELAEERGSGRD